MLIGSPCSFKLACKVFNPKETHPVLFETAIICATVGIMCPVMSFLAAIFYSPFAFFTQLFFIQPFVRTTFKWLLKKQNA